LEQKTAEIMRKYFNVGKKYIKRAGSSGVRVEEDGDIDIIHPDIEKIFPFVIECKNQEKWRMRDLFGMARNNKSNPFYSFIIQSEKELKDNNQIGMIVFSKNREDIYAFVYYKDIPKKEHKELNKMMDHKFISNINEYTIIGFLFEDFIKVWTDKYWKK
jgi:hypothetical protein